MSDKQLSEMTQEELVVELTGARDQLKKVNAESAGRRKKLEEFEQREEDLKKEKFSEAEKLQAEIASLKSQYGDLTTQLHLEKIRSTVISKAVELGFASPEDAFALADLSEVEITDGKVVGYEKSLEALAKSGRLTMDKKGDGLGTPPTKDKATPGSSTVEKAKPNFTL